MVFAVQKKNPTRAREIELLLSYLRPLGATALLAYLLSACGGGGSSGTTQPVTDPATPAALAPRNILLDGRTVTDHTASVITGARVALLSSAAYDNKDLNFSWDFGDGSMAQGVGAQHTFSAPGTYTVTLKLSNGTNSEASSKFTLQVLKASMTPIVAPLSGPGTQDAGASWSRFDEPRAVAVAADGTVYVADSGNGVIRRISTDGVVSTVVGLAYGASVDNAHADAIGAAASIPGPSALALDSKGTLYVVDYIGLRSVSPAGVVTTLARIDSSAAAQDGALGQVSLHYPGGVAVGPDDSVYVADMFSIRRIKDGQLTTVAGDVKTAGYVNGPAAQARFSFIPSLGFDAAGTLYVREYGYGVRKISTDGVVSDVFRQDEPNLASSSGLGAGSWAGMAVAPDGRVFISGEGHEIQMIGTDGRSHNYAGQHDVAGGVDGGTATFGDPAGLALAADGTLYIADILNNNIRSVDSHQITRTVAGVSADASGQVFPVLADSSLPFVSPVQLSVGDDSTTYFIQGRSVYRVQVSGHMDALKLDASGVASWTASGGGLSSPVRVAADHLGGLYVLDGQVIWYVGADLSAHRFDLRFPAGADITSYPQPNQMCVGPAGELMIQYAGTLVAVKPTGEARLFATLSNAGVSLLGVAPDGSARLQDGAMVYQVAEHGQLTVLAGGASNAAADMVDGQGSAAHFSYPRAWALDPAGAAWFIDWSRTGLSLRRVSPTGKVETIAYPSRFVQRFSQAAIDYEYSWARPFDNVYDPYRQRFAPGMAFGKDGGLVTSLGANSLWKLSGLPVGQ